MKCFSPILTVLVCLLVLPNRLNAYSLHSGLTEGCHERITRSAFLSAASQDAQGSLVEKALQLYNNDAVARSADLLRASKEVGLRYV